MLPRLPRYAGSHQPFHSPTVHSDWWATYQPADGTVQIAGRRFLLQTAFWKLCESNFSTLKWNRLSDETLLHLMRVGCATLKIDFPALVHAHERAQVSHSQTALSVQIRPVDRHKCGAFWSHRDYFCVVLLIDHFITVFSCVIVFIHDSSYFVLSVNLDYSFMISCSAFAGFSS